MNYVYLLILVISTILNSSVFAQYEGSLSHDECTGALRLPLNEWLHEDNTEASLSDAQSRPAPYPETCIPTYENDLWYYFDSEGADEFEIIIVHRECNTPSGLQAILIESEDCNPENFKTISCSSRKIADTIKIIFYTAPQPRRYLLYVDGYGGTTCRYDILFQKQEGASQNPSNMQYNRFYREYTPCAAAVQILPEVTFENNQPKLIWSDSQSDEVVYYAIERIISHSEFQHFEQVGLIKPEQTALGYQDAFSFSDYVTQYRNEDTYGYRVVRYHRDGMKTCSSELTGKAKVQNDFIVTEVEPSRQRGIYKVGYMLQKKQKYTIAILNSAFEVLKSKPLAQTEKGEYNSQLDLAEYPPGIYYFKLSSPTDYIIRKIEHLN